MPRSRRSGQRSTRWTTHQAGTPRRQRGTAASVVRFFCSTYGGAVAGVPVNEKSFIMLRAEVPGDDVIDVTIAGAGVQARDGNAGG